MTRTTGKRKRRTIVEEEIPEGSAIGTEEEPTGEFELSLEQVQDLETLNDVLAQYGIEDGVNFKIFKIVDGVPRYVFEHPTLDYGFIQRERGGGNYTARLFINGKYKKTVPVSIEDLPDSPHSNVNGNGSNGHTAFLEKMLMALILKESNGAGHSQPTVIELTQALQNLDSLRGKQESTMETFIKGMQMAKDFDGGGGSPDWKTEMLRLAKDNLPGVVGIVQSAIAQKNGGQPPTIVPTVPVETSPVATTEQDQMALQLKYAIGLLKSQFMMGLDGESALALIRANAGDPRYQSIIRQFLLMEFSELVALDADIGKEPFQSQFRFVHDGLRSEISEQDPVDDDTSGERGDVGDAGHNGESRPRR